MGRKLDKLMEDMQAELDGEKETVATEESVPTETPTETQPEPEPEPEPEPSKDEQPSEQPEPTEQKTEHRDIPDDPMKRAEYSFRRQLQKKDEKHAKELAERDEKYAELEKKFADLEKKLTPKEPEKTRDDFDNDEDFLQYLSDKRFDERMAQYNEEQAATRRDWASS